MPDPVYFYECQEAAFAPGIGDGWPEVIPAPHTKSARLVRCEGDPHEWKRERDEQRKRADELAESVVQMTRHAAELELQLVARRDALLEGLERSAKRAAERLFVDGATRLTLHKDHPGRLAPPGWSKEPLADRILEVLRAEIAGGGA